MWSVGGLAMAGGLTRWEPVLGVYEREVRLCNEEPASGYEWNRAIADGVRCPSRRFYLRTACAVIRFDTEWAYSSLGDGNVPQEGPSSINVQRGRARCNHT